MIAVSLLSLLIFAVQAPVKDNVPERTVVLCYDQGKEYFLVEPSLEGGSFRKLKIDGTLALESRNIQLKFHSDTLDSEFQYMLNGFDKGWTKTDGSESIIYSNLLPGTYNFKVRSGSTNQTSSMLFEIESPIWSKWWFLLLVVIFSFLTIIYYSHWRLKQKISKFESQQNLKATEVEKLRKKMARDFHDKLGNKLAGISVIINMVNLKLKRNEDDIESLILKIDQEAKNLFDGTKDFFWAIDPQSDNLVECFNYIKDYGEKLFTKSDTNFISSHVGLGDSEIKVNPGASKYLISIIKQIYQCYSIHTKSEEISLFLETIGNEFRFIIKDNGSSGQNQRNACYNEIKKLDTDIKISTKSDPGMYIVSLSGIIFTKSKVKISQTQN